MVSKTIFIYLIIFFPCIISGCHSFRDQSNFSGSDLNNNLECEKVKSNLNKSTPIVLYKGMVDCIKINQYKNGIFLYLLAGSYAYYDANRINTFYARKVHHDLLTENLALLTTAEYNSFWRILKNFMQQENQRKMVCSKIERIGVPDYQPIYMLRNKVTTISRYNIDYVLFKKSLNNYLNC
uniref:Lipoprotein n=1 Tax=Arsenophonus endosymbiont of Trialeurodes vaporariorum TaxID=235567 RepID=A0A3B0LZF9_9GAMM